MKTINLTQGKVTLVDDADYDELMQYKWRVAAQYTTAGKAIYHVARNNSGYAKPRTIMMHRQLMQPPAGYVVDHINLDGLDNRRENLRIVTKAENLRNKEKQLLSSGCECDSKYKGVTLNKQNYKWIARITFEGKRFHLGCFTSEMEAAIAYNNAAEEFFGAYAHLNDVVIE